MSNNTHHTPVTVVLPFYNAAATLSETLDSIQQQTLENFTLIAVDDGSSDHSAELLQQRMQHDPRIQLLQPGHQGVVGAMNTALNHCHSPLVARMDADDLMDPRRLELQSAYLQAHSEIDLLGSRVRMFADSPNADGLDEYIRWQNSCLSPQQIADNIYVELPIAHPSLMFRREVIAQAGAYREGDFPEDYELLLRLHSGGRRMAKLPEILLYWRDGDSRLTRTDARYSREAFDRVRADYLAGDPRLHGKRPLVLWGAGRKSRKRAAHLLAHGFTHIAWIDIDPCKIGNRVDGVPVVDARWLQLQPERPFVLNYVNNHGARQQVAAALEAMGYRQGVDFLHVG